ncbi:Putative lysophospholipase [Moraxella equi]|uniref:Lysophospholipase n=1 Tax=Moraxella equi TaxID=60442 RepID=A0A378QQ03_9GAMM|nr:alpha/beta hydrolase [Moraxella equi]OPH38109.1 hypothetical protein B5J93_06895 [Moraxella equi]STZ02540.1 Putative lysophospholipase [Moraxella equi]
MQPISTANIHEYHSTFNSYDGTAMFYRYWLTDKSERVYDHDDLKIIVMLHRGGHEHSQRLTDMAHAFVKQGYQVFAWDARGNGRSGGERDHAESFGQLVRDLDEFLKVIKPKRTPMMSKLHSSPVVWERSLPVPMYMTTPPIFVA